MIGKRMDCSRLPIGIRPTNYYTGILWIDRYFRHKHGALSARTTFYMIASSFPSLPRPWPRVLVYDSGGAVSPIRRPSRDRSFPRLPLLFNYRPFRGRTRPRNYVFRRASFFIMERTGSLSMMMRRMRTVASLFAAKLMLNFRLRPMGRENQFRCSRCFLTRRTYRV